MFDRLLVRSHFHTPLTLHHNTRSTRSAQIFLGFFTSEKPVCHLLSIRPLKASPCYHKLPCLHNRMQHLPLTIPLSQPNARRGTRAESKSVSTSIAHSLTIHLAPSHGCEDRKWLCISHRFVFRKHSSVPTEPQ